MARFSFEEEENEMESRVNSKRKNHLPIEDEKQVKSQKKSENEEKLSRAIENKKERLSVTIDPDVLDCFVCFEPLTPPLHQCENGHVACSVCCSKLPQNKCPTCSQRINFTRCRFLEKIIESIKSSCSYSKYGCNKELSYLEISSHQETCIYAPCSCPMPSCTFSGSSEQVSTHFHANHQSLTLDYVYGERFITYMHDRPFMVLPIQNGPLFLLLNDSHDKGNALSLACICPSSIECDFKYKLNVRNDESSLQFEASVVNVRKWEGVYPSKNFLLVPSNFSSLQGNVIDVCIKRGRMRSS